VALGRKGVSKIVTLEGTALANGLLSGGYYHNKIEMSNKQGTVKFDQAIKKLETDKSTLSESLKESRQSLEEIESKM
jgi:chromosome segregation ATPase